MVLTSLKVRAAVGGSRGTPCYQWLARKEQCQPARPGPRQWRWSAAVQFLFEDYVLDLDRRELTRGSKAIAIGPQVFDLLVYLIQNREHVVSKDNCWTWCGAAGSSPSRP